MARPESLCVYCHRQQIDPAWRPFCSERCRLADLGQWLSEGYRVPGSRDEDAAPELPDNVPKRDLDHEDD